MWGAGTVLLLMVLALTASSCDPTAFGAACVGSGTETTNLQLCKPTCGSTNWCADMNGNLQGIDGLFDASLGHTHQGTAGNGPKLLPAAMEATNAPSHGRLLTYDSATQKFVWGVHLTAENEDYDWTGEHDWTLVASAANSKTISFTWSGDVGSSSHAGIVITDNTVGNGSTNKTILNASANNNPGDFTTVWALNLAPEGGTAGNNYHLRFKDPESSYAVSSGLWQPLTDTRTIYWPNFSGIVHIETLAGGEVTIVDNGDGNAATATITPTETQQLITCNDSHGCDVTVGENVDVNRGRKVTFVNVSTNVVNFADTSGVTELAGAATLGQYDTLVLEYIGDRWVEISRSNN